MIGAVVCGQCGYRGTRVVASECPNHDAEDTGAPPPRTITLQRLRHSKCWYLRRDGDLAVEYVRSDISHAWRLRAKAAEDALAEIAKGSGDAAELARKALEEGVST